MVLRKSQQIHQLTGGGSDAAFLAAEIGVSAQSEMLELFWQSAFVPLNLDYSNNKNTGLCLTLLEMKITLMNALGMHK